MNLIKNIQINTKLLREGLIIIFCDNTKIVNEINTGLCKVTQGIQDRSAAVCEMINIIEETTIQIFIK